MARLTREGLIPVRVQLLDREVTLSPEQPVSVEVEITNDLEVIEGVSATLPRERGLAWTATPALLPLFPEGTGRIVIELRVTPSFPAGSREIPVELHSAVDGRTTRETLSLVVPELPGGTITVEPPVVSARRQASFTVRFANTGNTRLQVAFGASDPSRGTQASFVRPDVAISPGLSGATTMEATCKRRWLGGEQSHQLTVLGTAGHLELDTKAVFRQQPMIPRGARTVAVLAAIVALWAAIFAIVLSHAFSKDPLTKQVPASFYASLPAKAAKAGTSGKAKLQSLGGSSAGLTASSAAAPAGAVPKSGVVIGVGGSISGTVVTKSTGAGVGRINVEALEAGRKGLTVVASAATSGTGSYAIDGLLPGSYEVLFEAQGYHSVWYPNAASSAGAKPVTVDALAQTSKINAVISGDAGSITGVVDTGQTPSPPVTVTVQPQQGATGRPIATVRTTAGGSYAIRNLPTPGQYDLSFTASGYKVASSTAQLAGGQTLIANTVTLAASDGSIAGLVTAAGAPLGGVSITAEANGQTFTSATPTTGPIGRFSLVGLPSPATYLLTFSKTGYGTRIIGEQLGPGQSLSTLKVALEGGAGGIAGTVSSTDGSPLGGVTVTVEGGSSPVSTQSLTAGTVGAYALSGLATPGSYTLTFSLAGYESQTVAVQLASSGSAQAIDVRLHPELGAITGTVRSASGPLSGVDVSATDGTTTTTTQSTSQPAGAFLLPGLSPGNYSVTFSKAGFAERTYLITLEPGASRTVHVRLAAG